MTVQVNFDSQPSPGALINEDLAFASDRFAFVLDGATAPKGIDSGCRHSVAWYVSHLGAELARILATDDAATLPDALAASITRVRVAHSASCDLSNPASPSSTVAIIREGIATVDYLVLADSPIVLRMADGTVRVVSDTRTDRLPSYEPEAVRAKRNVSGGFWVASTLPEAAYEAVSGHVARDSVAGAGIFSDGTSRLAERHGQTWAQLMDLLELHGPSQVIAKVREADEHVAEGAYRGKRHDDATSLLCRFRAKRSTTSTAH